MVSPENRFYLIQTVSITSTSLSSGLASTYPEPQDKRKWLEDQLYNFNYECSMPVTWTWPRMPYIKTRELVPTKLYGKKSINNFLLFLFTYLGAESPLIAAIK